VPPPAASVLSLRIRPAEARPQDAPGVSANLINPKGTKSIEFKIYFYSESCGRSQKTVLTTKVTGRNET
jgi:hypothetical protein